MIKRLGLVIHWLGFICLVTLIGGYTLEILDGGSWFFAGDVWDVIPSIVEDLFDMFTFRGIEERHWITSIAILHWPIKFIITGNKAFFPWMS
jgi:hypothetical protein